MSEPFLAEVHIFGFNFAPRGYAKCDGQLIPIDQNQSLFSLLGTTYGGDGRTNFALPDLRGRVPIHNGQSPGGSNHTLGERDGEEAHALTLGEVPTHDHPWRASNQPGDVPVPTGAVLAAFNNGYSASGDTSLATGTVAGAGGGQGHENMAPYLTINYCIALQGVFPSRN